MDRLIPRAEAVVSPSSTVTTGISTALLLLAAGASRRMQRTKALLPFSPHQSFLERLLEVYRTVGAEPFVVLSCAGKPDIVDLLNQSTVAPTLVWNNDPNGDRLSSILAGLEAIPADRYIFIQDVDRPFVAPSLLRTLIESAHSAGYTVPAFDNKPGHPPLLSPAVARALRNLPRLATLQRALKQFDRTLVPVKSHEHDININTPGEYERHVAQGHAY